MSILKERQKTHGEYANVAFVAQSIKNILRGAPNYHTLSLVQCESVDLIATKLARIVCGNASEPDHWLDGSGYFKLGYNELQNKNTASRANITIMEMDPDESIDPSIGDDWDSYYIPRSGLPR
jgi:hypothetical protein